MELADELRDAAKDDLVPSFDLENRAQKGGAAIGLAIDIATGVKALATGAAKLGVRNADELHGIARDGAALRQTGGGSQTELADEMYDAIRNSETDVKSIAENTGFKEENIQSVKDHVFNDEHLLDRYVDQGEPATVGRFDSNANQAEAWNRLEAGTHTPEDITWMKHETAESWYEKKYDSGYSEAHDRVEDRWSGNPWGNE